MQAHATRGIPLYQVLLIATALAVAVVMVVQYALVPYVTKRLLQDDVSPGDLHAEADGGECELMPLTAALGAASDSSAPSQQATEADGAGVGGLEGTGTVVEEGGALTLPSDARIVDPVGEGTRQAADREGSWSEGEIVDIDLNDGDEESHLDTLELEESVSPAERLFRYLQVTTACGMSFAHGANDTANAAGPFAAMQAIFLHGSCAAVDTPLWVLLTGGVGITLGFATFGHRVRASSPTRSAHRRWRESGDDGRMCAYVV
jgi:phosphate/sulfate permease